MFWQASIAMCQKTDKLSKTDMVFFAKQIVSAEIACRDLDRFLTFYSQDVVDATKFIEQNLASLSGVPHEFIDCQELSVPNRWSGWSVFLCVDLRVTHPDNFVVAITTSGHVYPLQSFDYQYFDRLVKNEIRNVTSESEAFDIIKMYLNTVHYTSDRRVLIDSTNYRTQSHVFHPLTIAQTRDGYEIKLTTLTSFSSENGLSNQVIFYDFMISNQADFTVETKVTDQ